MQNSTQLLLRKASFCAHNHNHVVVDIHINCFWVCSIFHPSCFSSFSPFKSRPSHHHSSISLIPSFYLFLLESMFGHLVYFQYWSCDIRALSYKACLPISVWIFFFGRIRALTILADKYQFSLGTNCIYSFILIYIPKLTNWEEPSFNLVLQYTNKSRKQHVTIF